LFGWLGEGISTYEGDNTLTCVFVYSRLVR